RGDRGDLVTPSQQRHRNRATCRSLRDSARPGRMANHRYPGCADHQRIAERCLATGEEMIIDTADLDPTSSYKLLIGSILPRAIAGVSTSPSTGVGIFAPLSFFPVAGRYPPVLSITLQPRSDGVTLKDTFVNIRDTNEFVVNIA